MTVIVYGDFNCPYSYLASQRTDELNRTATEVFGWRAVEHDRGLALTGTPSDRDQAAWERELAEVARLALPGEHMPLTAPPVISNTRAAVAAYAEAVTDGVAAELRWRLFRAIWAGGRHLSGAYEVRRLITAVMWPAEDINARLASPDFPSMLLRDPDLTRITRRSGGTIAPDGGPLTTAGYRRIRQWRHDWLALPAQTIPAVIGSDRVLRSGADGLRYLADLAERTGVGNQPDRAGTAAGRADGTAARPGRVRPAARAA
jgi:hypothetical protein